jgi:hypothetical protein
MLWVSGNEYLITKLHVIRNIMEARFLYLAASPFMYGRHLEYRISQSLRNLTHSHHTTRATGDESATDSHFTSSGKHLPMRTTTKTCQTCFTGWEFNVFVRESGWRLHETIVRLLAVVSLQLGNHCQQGIIIQFLSRKYKMWIKFFRRYMYASRTYFYVNWCTSVVSIAQYRQSSKLMVLFKVRARSNEKTWTDSWNL